MERLKINFNGLDYFYETGTKLSNIITQIPDINQDSLLLCKLDNIYHELWDKIELPGKLIPIYCDDSEGKRAYLNTTLLILIKAANELFPKCKVYFEYTIGNGLYGEISKDRDLTDSDIELLISKMNSIISKNMNIRKISLSLGEALKIFKRHNAIDKIRLYKNSNLQYINLYELQGTYETFNGFLASNTSLCKTFNLIKYKSGFLVLVPNDKNASYIPTFVDYPKLSQVFLESEKWHRIIGVSTTGELNEKINNKSIMNIIRMNEALHEKKIAQIADMIKERESVKVILIAGPSSSGKTTFSKRLSVQIMVNGQIPIYLGTDDYFVEREKTPRDEKGDYDFESLEALDIDLFNKNLTDLLNGMEVSLPTFNFKTGKKEWNRSNVKMPENGVLLVEGIHGLNDALTVSIPKENKFKIYISPLTQLNLDDHNRVPSTDVRIIRRMVRDYLSRGYDAEETFLRWPSVRKGEEKNIFIYQENADVMFNSSLIYELGVLNKFAIAQFNTISEESSVYSEVLRLKSMINLFQDIPIDLVPDNSILREFIGGSIFYTY